jgi:hypothetical protein
MRINLKNKEHKANMSEINLNCYSELQNVEEFGSTSLEIRLNFRS